MVKVKAQNLTQKQHNILIGSLLGDAHIQKTRANTGNCRIRWAHCETQKDYVKWTYQQFKDPFCQTTKPPFMQEQPKAAYPGQPICSFYTGYSSAITPYHSEWYVETQDPKIQRKFVKIVPPNIDKLLVDPLALATWYLDDGNKRKNEQACRIATHGFTEIETILLQDCLKKNFAIVSSVQKHGLNKQGISRYQLILGSRTEGYKTLRSLIYDVVKAEIPSMLDKLL